MYFLTDFHFHAKNIINRTALWSKLDETERFKVLEDIIDIIIKHDITFYIGVLDKAVYQSTISLRNNNMGNIAIYMNNFKLYRKRHI